MHFSTFLTSASLIAGTALAAPTALNTRVTIGGKSVVYWGQNGGSTVENNDLSTYCTSTSGVDIVVMAFLYQYGNGVTAPGGTIGQSCSITAGTGVGSNCDALASQIATCQANGKKVMLSLGGAVGAYGLASDAEAETIGQYLWDSYGNSGSTSVPRPFGTVAVDGWDFDIEAYSGNEYYPTLISTLRGNFAKDTSKTYYITGAPQCPLPEPNMNVIITGAKFDYLWVQFYNNDCALPYNGHTAFNFDAWVTFLESTPSADADLIIGVPASTLASNGYETGATYYITPDQLSELVAQYGTSAKFAGVMTWSAGFSDSNVIDGCTYAQHMFSILNTGAPCNGSPASGSGNSDPTTTSSSKTVTSTTTSSSSTSSSSSTTAPGTVTTKVAVPTTTLATSVKTLPTETSKAVVPNNGLAQWAQCGGNGYTGSTTCASGYTCVFLSQWWSQCE